jgi:hypothetical protein
MERKALTVFASRLLNGQKVYGFLYNDKKDWTFEALEEVMDALVYLSAALADKQGKALASIEQRTDALRTEEGKNEFQRFIERSQQLNEEPGWIASINERANNEIGAAQQQQSVSTVQANSGGITPEYLEWLEQRKKSGQLGE